MTGQIAGKLALFSQRSRPVRHLCQLLVGLAFLLGQAPASLAQAPTCTGDNVLDELRTSDARAHAGIVAAAAATENSNALLWKIEKPGSRTSYLFGTMHLTDERVTRLSPAIAAAFASARRVVLEIDDFSPVKLMGLLLRSRQLVMFTDGRRLDQLLSPEEFKRASEIMGRSGVPASVTGLFRPWVASMLMALSDCEKRRVGDGLLALDAQLAKQAKERGILVAGLETLEMQFRAMASVPEADQVESLKASLRFSERIDDLIETMVQLYLTRQLGAIWPLQLALAEKVGVVPEAFASAERSLLTVRNLGMRDGALEHLAEGGAFIAVGALHLPGKQGLVTLLRESGYTLSAVE
jgi:hypothetical protein